FLALLPTATILAIFGFVEVLSHQRLLFASLASSAFLIYLDPQHGTNATRTLVASQMLAALSGWLTYAAFGPGYAAGGTALVSTIVLMVSLDVMHPPAVATALSFAFRAGDAGNLLLFGLAVVVTAVLVVLEQVTLRLLAHYAGRKRSEGESP
ncbi:MAG TPA: HPP family protein, partial [Planctomycetaceae bacterium]